MSLIILAIYIKAPTATVDPSGVQPGGAVDTWQQVVAACGIRRDVERTFHHY